MRRHPENDLFSSLFLLSGLPVPALPFSQRAGRLSANEAETKIHRWMQAFAAGGGRQSMHQGRQSLHPRRL